MDESDLVLGILSQIHVNTDNEWTDLDQVLVDGSLNTNRPQMHWYFNSTSVEHFQRAVFKSISLFLDLGEC